ncbi:glutamate-rich protein 2-like isoform X2 [Lineus longissimus]|uniref:glutamate-rich protein 2-like isoform X2 n=1 Tax=Lineus longissimus TaxID=88925 RepID=UPI00315CD046
MATGISKKSRQPDGDLVVLGQGQGTVNASPRQSSSGTKIVGRPLSRQSSSGGFEVLQGSFVDSRPSSAASDGRGSSASGRRSYTPSKQVALPTVRRKEDSEDSFGALNWREHEELEEKKLHLNSGDGSSLSENMNNLSMNHEKLAMNGDIAQEGSDGEDEEDESSSEEEEEVKAPNELMMEFVACMMQQDYANALKLCKMILIYEPENAEAKEFLPVIEEKMQLDAEAEAEGGEEESGESGDEDDDEDDEGGSDDDSDDDNSESDDDSSEDSDEDDDKETSEQATTVVFNIHPS